MSSTLQVADIVAVEMQAARLTPPRIHVERQSRAKTPRRRAVIRSAAAGTTHLDHAALDTVRPQHVCNGRRTCDHHLARSREGDKHHRQKPDRDDDWKERDDSEQIYAPQSANPDKTGFDLFGSWFGGKLDGYRHTWMTPDAPYRPNGRMPPRLTSVTHQLQRHVGRHARELCRHEA